MPIAAIPLHSIYIVVSYLGEALCDDPTLADPYRNKKSFFGDYYVYGTKN